MILRRIILSLSLIASALFIFSCEGDDEGGNGSSNKPKARGAIGEILVVIDSTKWQGPAGEAVREVFQEDIKGIMRSERLFSVRRVDPRSITRMLKLANNIVYVTSFDDRSGGSQKINQQFNEESRQMVADDPTMFMLRSKDEFAVGQEVLYLFGTTENDLIRNLRENKSKLQNLFQVRERERLGRTILKRKSGELSRLGQDKFDINLNIPASYQLVKDENNFIWARQPTPTADRPDISLFFYQTDYKSEDQLFPENLVEFRNSITRNHIFGDPNNRESYLVTERREEPPLFNNFNIQGNYAVEMRGSWRTNTYSMGGSFLSYIVVDEKKGKIYYMEGFVYYPNEAHRESLREIETILLATEFPNVEEAD
ncbi:DUF4837 family protein [Litoribacter alkaliphilus]|uniref:DUF4837 family protein n=1 Tax=Litoribacter ruber TaxID=702568 RepID=A0AAP2CEM7_9BACT|nr:DUF4837 family protein [Litoribacter alkaliphilus]MBS9522963.1 DUF4837 family protein [Litoribacter alkaliphilus]